MSNTDDQDSRVFTLIFNGYNLIPPYRLLVKFDVNVFNNIKTNVFILLYKTDIVTHVANN